MSFNIAIDGPAAAGKTTTAKRVAKELGYLYIDTGAMYRAMGLYLIRKGIPSSDHETISAVCEEANISISYKDGKQIVHLDGENVNDLIRTEEAGRMASDIGVIPAVREKLVALQQRLAEWADTVMEGRDIGTCVLPNAQVKVYLTADRYTRAWRRYQELSSKGIPCNLEKLEEELTKRDRQDMTRDVSPLKQADDAVLIDNSHRNVDETVEAVLALVKERRR